MKVLYWLGNPFERHKNNRHNVWYLFLDYLSIIYSDTSKFIRDYENKLYIKTMSGWNFVLAKSTVNMNDQGISFNNILKIFPMNLEKDILVIYDDLDYKIWEFALKKKASWTHNWILSINSYVWWVNYRKFRVWVENRDKKWITSWKDYLLSDFSAEEKKILYETFDKMLIHLNLWIEGKIN